MEGVTVSGPCLCVSGRTPGVSNVYATVRPLAHLRETRVLRRAASEVHVLAGVLACSVSAPVSNRNLFSEFSYHSS